MAETTFADAGATYPGLSEIRLKSVACDVEIIPVRGNPTTSQCHIAIQAVTGYHHRLLQRKNWHTLILHSEGINPVGRWRDMRQLAKQTGTITLSDMMQR